MPVKIKCPNPACGKSGSVSDEQVGKSLRCPHCKTRFAVSAKEPSAPTTEIGPETQEHVPATEEYVVEHLAATTEHRPEAPGVETVSASGASATLGQTNSAAAAQPRHISRFEVRGTLGAGAFGTVYRAFDPQLDREVALKIPQPGTLDSALRVERFLREAKTAAKLRHPNIVPVFEAGQDGDTLFIATAFIEGQSLDSLMEAGTLETRRAVEIVRASAEALACAHENGIVHRDVKPANIMIDKKGLPLLMDFGLAHHRQEAVEKLTQQGTILGTPAYMAPEQAKGQTGDPMPAGDQYSLGVILYELLCGQRPFRGSLEVVLFNTIHTAPTPCRDIKPTIPVELELVCMRALSKRPPDRFPTCQAMADSLAAWLELDKKAKEAARPVSQTHDRPRSVYVPKPVAAPEPMSAPMPSAPSPSRAKLEPKKVELPKKKTLNIVPLAIGLSVVLFAVLIWFLWPKTVRSLPLTGTWIVQSMQVAGKTKPDAKGITWVIEGESLVTDEKKQTGTIKTDKTKQPNTIDVVEDMSNPALSASGICELSGDTLKICFGTREGRRPTEFSSTAKNQQAVLIMQKQKP